VEESGLDGHYDFALNWTPDETQFASVGIKLPQPSDKADAPLVIDRVEKPLGN
jgi:hypothetical protein